MISSFIACQSSTERLVQRCAHEADLQVCATLHHCSELSQALSRESPDVLFLDTNLGSRHGGLQFVQAGRIPDEVPTILISDDVDAQTLECVRRARTAGFLIYPFIQSQFEATVAAALGSVAARGPTTAQRELQAPAVLDRIVGELKRAQYLSPRLRHGLRLRDLPALSSLSPREWEVLRGLIDHRRVPALARDMQISPHTVRNHLKSIFAKLHVRSQIELLDKVIAADHEPITVCTGDCTILAPDHRASTRSGSSRPKLSPTS